ncbi:MAG: nucleotide sugar dehydrogenase, partial [Bacteroidetes bacterium]|nr:nucleotide sugar dehydrogenase [Bacteroidota bacterium]
GAKALILGITFKENCPDIRNSRVIDIIREFETYDVIVDVCDPWASANDVKEEYNLNVISCQSELNSKYEAIILAVSHHQFLEIDLEQLKSETGVVFDVKSFYTTQSVDARL